MSLYLRGVLLAALVLFSSLPAHAKELDVQKELSYRIEFGNPNDVRILLDKGADPNGVNDLGWPLVSVAARRTDGKAVDIVDMLVRAGAELNQGGPSRQYPIIIAARNGDVALAHYLLQKGVDTAVRDRNGVEPVEIAKYYGHEDVFEILQELALKRAEELERRRSPERMQELRRNLVAESCAAQYMAYYFKSGQDKFSDEAKEEALADRHVQMTTSINDLFQIFKTPMTDIQVMRDYGAQQIYTEMESLISNRNRRKHGIGAEGDIEKRCGKIADEWQAAQQAEDNKEKKEEEIKKLRKGGMRVVR